MKFKRKLKQILMVMMLIISLTACSLPGLGASVQSDGIIVAGGNTTERQILAEIVVQMIDHYLDGGKPQIINNLGSTLLIHQAMERQDANVSGSMYTGTSLTGELGMEATTDPKEAMERVVQGYSGRFDTVWFPSYGFENTYAFMMSRTFAEQHNIQKISDLEKLKDTIHVGVDTGWLDRPGDGYEGFQSLYGFSFGDIRPMEIGLVYDAIHNGNMDVALGYSTDGRINAYDLVIIEDDKHLFPPYESSPVVKKRLLKKYPQLESILLKLEGEISSETMQRLNRLADDEKIEPNIVAKKFLEENQYFESKTAQPLRERPLYREIMSDVLPSSGGGQ